MNHETHNPNAKLISVVIDGKELVYGETNTGQDKGLEVYYLNGDPKYGHYYSRRFAGRKMPMIYDSLVMYLSKLIPYCKEGHKLSLERSEYGELVVLFNIQPPKYC